MKNTWIRRLGITIAAAALCGNLGAHAVLADEAAADMAAPAAAEETVLMEDGAGAEAQAGGAVPEAPEAPTAPEAPVRPDVEGLDAAEANEQIRSYNEAVDAYNSGVQAYNEEADAYEAAKARYNEQAAAYNLLVEADNAAADEHDRLEEEKAAASDAAQAKYEQQKAVYDKNVATIKTISERNTGKIAAQEQALGDIGRVTKETVTQLGTVLTEDYFVKIGRRSVQLGKAGDLLVRWDDLLPTGDHNTILVSRDGDASGETYKVANLHIFQDFADVMEMSDYMEEHGWDCLNINTDDQAGAFIIPAALIDRLVLLEYEVAEADRNDSVTLTNQSGLFAPSASFMTQRYLDGYTAGRYWVNQNVFSSTARITGEDLSGTAHTISYKDGTTDGQGIRNPLNVNQYLWFERYYNPQPVRPDVYVPDFLARRSPLALLEGSFGRLQALPYMDLLEILQDEPEAFRIPEAAVPAGAAETGPAGASITEGPSAEAPDAEIREADVPSAAVTAPAIVPAVTAPASAAADTAEAAVPAPAAAAEGEIIEIADAEAPLAAAPSGAEIAEGDVPMAALPSMTAPEKYWALLNLICAILTALTAFGMILTFFRRRRGEEDREQGAQEQGDGDGRSRRPGKFLGIVPAAAAAVLFVLTEDMTALMRLADRWTVYMILILLAGALLACVTRDRAGKADKARAAAA